MIGMIKPSVHQDPVGNALAVPARSSPLLVPNPGYNYQGRFTEVLVPEE